MGVIEIPVIMIAEAGAHGKKKDLFCGNLPRSMPIFVPDLCENDNDITEERRV